MSSGIVAAIYASIFLALSQASLKKSFRELEPSVAFFFDAMFGLFLWIPLALYFGVNFNNLPQVMTYAIISAILSEAFVFYALSKGQLSLTAILVGSYPIYTIFFSYLINHEALTWVQGIFIAITILGTLVSYIPSKLSASELKKSGAILWPLLAAVAIGLSDTLSKKIIDQTGDYTFLLALALVQLPVALIYLRIEKAKILPIIKKVTNKLDDYKNVIAGSLFNIVGTGLLWISFSFSLASIASPITATSGSIVLILALLFLDEKIKARQIFGILLVIVGIIGISMQG